MSIVILGGGTFSDVAPHLSLCARAFGSTAIELYEMVRRHRRDVELKLTKMADSRSSLVTNADVSIYVDQLLIDPKVKAIIFSAAMCDFSGVVGGVDEGTRLSSNEIYQISLIPDTFKVLSKIKVARPDIFLVGFKTTSYADFQTQIDKAQSQIEKCGCDMVLANDIGTRNNTLVFKDNFEVGSRRELLERIGRLTLNSLMK